MQQNFVVLNEFRLLYGGILLLILNIIYITYSNHDLKNLFRHKGNGAILARCSQPEVGWLGWRSSEDEDLLKAIAESCQNKSKKPKVNT